MTQDVPSRETIGKYYEGDAYISHSDSQDGLVNKLYHRARRIMLSKKFDLVRKNNANNRHLDYGAGTGYFVKYLIDQGLQADGVEIDADARAYAKKQHQVDLYAPDALFDQAADETYDTISMWHVLEHIHDLDVLVAKLKSLLTQDGTLLVAVPNHTSTDGDKYGAYWAGYDVPRHLWHFSPATMHRLMAKHRLQVVSMRGMLFDPYYNSMLSERYQGHGMALLRGSISGMSNSLASLLNVERSSSIIYTIKKQ